MALIMAGDAGDAKVLLLLEAEVPETRQRQTSLRAPSTSNPGPRPPG